MRRQLPEVVGGGRCHHRSISRPIYSWVIADLFFERKGVRSREGMRAVAPARPLLCLSPQSRQTLCASQSHVTHHPPPRRAVSPPHLLAQKQLEVLHARHRKRRVARRLQRQAWWRGRGTAGGRGENCRGSAAEHSRGWVWDGERVGDVEHALRAVGREVSWCSKEECEKETHGLPTLRTARAPSSLEPCSNRHTPSSTPPPTYSTSASTPSPLSSAQIPSSACLTSLSLCTKLINPARLARIGRAGPVPECGDVAGAATCACRRLR